MSQVNRGDAVASGAPENGRKASDRRRVSQRSVRLATRTSANARQIRVRRQWRRQQKYLLCSTGFLPPPHRHRRRRRHSEEIWRNGGRCQKTSVQTWLFYDLIIKIWYRNKMNSKAKILFQLWMPPKKKKKFFCVIFKCSSYHLKMFILWWD